MENKGSGCAPWIMLAILIGIIGAIMNSCGGKSDSDYIDAAHSAVLDQLKAPSTASWCNDDTVGDSPGGSEGDKIVVGCVNAQNSFGGTVEVDYSVYEDKDANVKDVEARNRE